MLAEYQTEVIIDQTPWPQIRWLKSKEPVSDETDTPQIHLPTGCALARDTAGQWLVLLPDAWVLGYLEEKNATYSFQDHPFPVAAAT